MSTQRNPIRWPLSWKDPSRLNLLKGTHLNTLLVEQGQDLGRVAERARLEGLTVTEAESGGATIIEGEWPGVRLSETGGIDRVSAGPTGAPWVDSNGWKIRLAAARRPGSGIWVDTAMPKAGTSARAYQIAVADASVHGGRWIVSLDGELAAGVDGGDAQALETWRKLTGAVDFFASREAWSDYRPKAVIGIISDFTGSNEFMTQEILNLVARTNQQYRILIKTTVGQNSFEGLRGILYADDDPPSPKLRRLALEFVKAGGILITGPKWGDLPGRPGRPGNEHPRYELRVLGQGRVAIARPDFEDPYLVANDSAVLISHRYELLRFWNGGAIGSYFTAGPDGRKAVVQMLFYAGAHFGKPTVRVAGPYRKAALWTLDHAGPGNVEMEVEQDAVELHLPPVTPYAAAELGI